MTTSHYDLDVSISFLVPAPLPVTHFAPNHFRPHGSIMDVSPAALLLICSFFEPRDFSNFAHAYTCTHTHICAHESFNGGRESGFPKPVSTRLALPYNSPLSPEFLAFPDLYFRAKQLLYSMLGYVRTSFQLYCFNCIVPIALYHCALLSN